jgi:Tfp pilus assembly protein PilF
LFRYLIVVGGILLLIGCSSTLTKPQAYTSAKNDSNTSVIKLSHVKAYLLIGSIKQAQTTFDNIKNKEIIPLASLVQAELSAASGDAMAAQQAFLLAIQNKQLVENSFSDNLLDYFCAEKKWPALQGYGEALIASTPVNKANIEAKNNAISQIGMCFYGQQRWDETNYWLEKVDVTQSLSPLIYLALARTKVEQQEYSTAKVLMDKFEAHKTEVDAKSLWTTIEVYRALNQPQEVTKYGEHLRSLFPNNEYTRNYIITVKRGERVKRRQQETMALTETSNFEPVPPALEQSFHIIIKGETLYQLSKRYSVSIPELQAWNPSLVIDDISVGTKIQVTRNR